MAFFNRSRWGCQRENNREYLVITVQNNETDYTERMVSRNRIEALVPFSRRELNGDVFYYYDITGKKVFSDMFNGENDMMERMDVERICTSICMLSDSLKEYLLDENHVVIEPESMFYNVDKQIYEFLYVPGNVKSLFAITGAEADKRIEERTGLLCEDVKVYHGEVEDMPGEDYDFKRGVRCVWDRVMDKFDHHSGIEDIKRVYEIHQKVNSESFDPGEVFAAGKEKRPSNMTEIMSKQEVADGNYREKETDSDCFSRESLKNNILGGENTCINDRTDDSKNPAGTKEIYTGDGEKYAETENILSYWSKEEKEEIKKGKNETLGEKIMAFDLKTYFGDLSKRLFSGKVNKKRADI